MLSWISVSETCTENLCTFRINSGSGIKRVYWIIQHRITACSLGKLQVYISVDLYLQFQCRDTLDKYEAMSSNIFLVTSTSREMRLMLQSLLGNRVANH